MGSCGVWLMQGYSFVEVHLGVTVAQLGSDHFFKVRASVLIALIARLMGASLRLLGAASAASLRAIAPCRRWSDQQVVSRPDSAEFVSSLAYVRRGHFCDAHAKQSAVTFPPSVRE